MNLDDLIRAAEKVEAATLAAWQAEDAKVRRDIANAVATKTSMHEHYWEKRHKLEQQLRSARSLRIVLEEINREGA